MWLVPKSSNVLLAKPLAKKPIVNRRPTLLSKKTNRAHSKGGNGKGGIRICLPVHCFSAPSDGNSTVTQMRHPLLVEGQPNCARQSLASTLPAPCVAATSYCDPGRHAHVITPCLLTPCLNVPKKPKADSHVARDPTRFIKGRLFAFTDKSGRHEWRHLFYIGTKRMF